MNYGYTDINDTNDKQILPMLILPDPTNITEITNISYLLILLIPLYH